MRILSRNHMLYAGSLCWPAGFLLYDSAPQATRQGWPAVPTCDGEPAYGMPLENVK